MAFVRVSRAAQRDLTAIVRYLADTGGREPAYDFVQSIEHPKERLAVHPFAYASRPKLGRDVRGAVVGSYLVVYQHRAGSDGVVLLRVLHGRRDTGPTFRRLS